MQQRWCASTLTGVDDLEAADHTQLEVGTGIGGKVGQACKEERGARGGRRGWGGEGRERRWGRAG